MRRCVLTGSLVSVGTREGADPVPDQGSGPRITSVMADRWRSILQA